MGNFKTNLVEYYKLILTRVSFSKRLFWKEYKKGIKSLPEHETHSLRHWIVQKFLFRGRTAAKLAEKSKVSHSNISKLKNER